MLFPRVSGLTVLLLLANDKLVTADTEKQENEAIECRLWLGPSHLGSEMEPEYGLFAGKDFDADEVIPDIELAIPLVDWTEEFNRGTEANKLIVEFVESQVWTGDFAGAKWEGDHSTIVAVPGIGNLANYHSGTYNVDWYQPAALLRKPVEIFQAGVAHVNRGAITPFHNMTMKATQRIPAGMELFANFGETWDSSTNADDSFQEKLTRWDYQHADQILDAIVKFMDAYDNDLTPDLKEDILNFMLEKILSTAAGKRAKVIRSLIPENPNKLKKVQEMGGTFLYRNSDMIKSQKWLKKHAICMDDLRIGKSTILEAGRGAFATREVKKGKIIVPSPMIHIANEDLLDMYQIAETPAEGDEVVLEHDMTKFLGKQLLLNYCYGHRESSVLLFPIGNQVNLINHAPKGKANAYITWSRHKHVTNDHSLHDLSVDELAKHSRVGVVMVVQALRDIKVGEEIFIDYGDEWAEAWDEHVATWKREYGNGKAWDLKAEDMREQYKNIPFVTELVDGVNPYPPSVATTCYLKTDEVPDGTPRRTEDGTEIFRFSDEMTPENFTGADMYVCDVLSRSEKLNDGNLYNYTVLAKIADDDIVQVKDVPHVAITFVDQPYQSDIHFENAFRHKIAIPDRDFPQAWRNLRN